MRDATVETGQIFPIRLSTMDSGCSYPAAQNPPVLDEFSREWYSSHLLAAGEPSLVSVAQESPPEARHLRFTWLRSFHAPVVIRVSTLPDGRATMVAKRLSGMGGYKPGEIADRVERSLELTEIRQIDDFIEKSKLPDERSNACEIGLDGAQWIVEVVQGDSYYFIDRWTPEKGPVREFGLLMLGLTGWPIDAEDIY